MAALYMPLGYHYLSGPELNIENLLNDLFLNVWEEGETQIIHQYSVGECPDYINPQKGEVGHKDFTKKIPNP